MRQVDRRLRGDPAGLSVRKPGEPWRRQQQSGPLVHSIDLDLTIDPASAAWVDQSLDDAKKDGADLVDVPPRHSGRARRVDARDRQGHHRRADAGRRLRIAGRRARGVRRAVRHRGRRRRRDGAADQHRLGHADLDRPRRAGPRARPQDPQRRRGLRARAGRGTRPQPRPRGADGARGDQRDGRRGKAPRPDRPGRHRRAGPARKLDGFRVKGAEAAGPRHQRRAHRAAGPALQVPGARAVGQPQHRLPSVHAGRCSGSLRAASIRARSCRERWAACR